jgi:hypothetical protein
MIDRDLYSTLIGHGMANGLFRAKPGDICIWDDDGPVPVGVLSRWCRNRKCHRFGEADLGARPEAACDSATISDNEQAARPAVAYPPPTA